METTKARGEVVYTGRRTEDGCVVTVAEGGRTRPLAARLDLRNHSPTGFEWGYEGSGPAQLALALLVDATRDLTDALDIYQVFKRQVIARLTSDTWVMSIDHVLRAASEARAFRGVR